ncbi:MAG: FAD:protein FMN transferase [Streptococcaceae bacterium]|jgi:thiamine biosynthesis lipoprotein|nr:FAD:protein FMN transferase [Streptococcaceae bacterium]
MKKKLLFLFPIIALFFILSACGNNNSSSDSRNLLSEPLSKSEFILGTHVSVRIYDRGKEQALEDVFKYMSELGDKLDVNNNLGSQMDQVNAAAGKHPVVVDEDVFWIVQEAMRYAKESNGIFEPTIGPITSLWRIGFDDARKPSQAEIDEKLKLVNYHWVTLNEKDRSVFLQKEGMKIDLGAIAKGAICDLAVKFLEERGVTTGIVDLGGNVFVIGHSFRGETTPWNVGVQDPNQARNTTIFTLPGVDQSFVTSGIYERFLEVDGVKYHHIMDPKTGYPMNNDLASVSIISPHSVDGDGLTTVLFGLGVEKGRQFIENMDGIDAVFVTRENKVYVTNGIKNEFVLPEGSAYTMGE